MKTSNKKIFIITGIVVAIVIILVIVAIVICISSGNNTSKKEDDILISLDDNSIVRDEKYNGTFQLEYDEIDMENANYTTKIADYDEDGLNNIDEYNLGTDMYNPDTDEDGLNDGLEVKTYNTNPLKYSSRDDDISDLDWIFQDGSNFTEGYVEDEMSGFLLYLSKPEHRAYKIDVVDMDEFDSLDTISSIFKIQRFSGKMAFSESVYTSEIYKHITVYAYRNNALVELDIKAYESKVEFDVQDGDIIALVYVKDKSNTLYTGKETLGENGKMSAVYQAEAATIVGSASSSGHYVGYVGNGGEIHFDEVISENGGNYTLKIIYYTKEDRQIFVKVNEADIITLDCKSNGSWDSNAGTISIDIVLNKGINKISLLNDSAYAPNIDYIELFEK